VIASLEQDDTSGYTPLHFASSNGNYGCMLLLLSKIACKGSDANSNGTSSGATTSTTDTTEAATDTGNTTGTSNVTTATSKHHHAACNVVDIPDARGRTALHLAALNGHADIAALLASKTSNVDLIDM